VTDVAERKAATLARVADAIGAPLVKAGADVLLPDGRRLVMCWSKPHHGGRDYYIGLPNRLVDGDALIVGLGDDDIVFPAAGWLLQYSPLFSHSNDDRPNPRFLRHGRTLLLSIARLDQSIPLDGYVGNYRSLVESARAGALPASAGKLGRPFKKPEVKPSSPRQPFAVDPDKVDRATKGHADTLIALAEHLETVGIVPHEWTVPQPLFDLAWEHTGTLFVAEVKSLTLRNEERQLRLGLGQVLRYRQTMSSVIEGPCTAVLCAEREPADHSWLSLCASLDVVLVWPPDFNALSTR
jgi:hypothetical protein